MKFSIKYKFILAISILIGILFVISAFLLVDEKEKELTSDTFFETRSFAEFSSTKVVNDYNLYLAQKGFIFFNREIQNIFSKTQNVSIIQLYDYNGQMLFDSAEEKEQQYEGPSRIMTDETLTKQIKAHNPSVYTDKNRLVFLKKDEEGNIGYVDENENDVEPLDPLERVLYFVNPVLGTNAVYYLVDYSDLDARLVSTQIRIFSLAALGIILGILMAIFFGNRITKPIKKLTSGAAVIAQGEFSHRVNIKTRDEVQTLGEAFNKMAKDLEISTKALVYKERVAKELELAKKIQESIIPKEMPKLLGIDVSAGLVPAEEIGGDCYDFIPVDDNNMVMYMGDVTGHGVPSGIVVSIANALFYSFAGKGGLKEVMIEVNKVIKAKTTTSMFLTLILMNWDALNQKLNYVSAGHEPTLHYSAKTKQVSLLKGGGIALGMFPDISKAVEIQEAALEPGDVLVMYSDGIPEAWKNEKEMYGMDRFKEALAEYGSLDTSLSIRNALFSHVKEFAGDFKQMDDMTLLVVKKV